MRCLCRLLTLSALWLLTAGTQPPANPQKQASQDVLTLKNGDQALKPAARIRPLCPIRMGGVYLMGLGENSPPFEESAKQGIKLSADNERWLAENCDVVALSPSTVTPQTFPNLMRAQPLITTLLYVYASSLYEDPTRSGNVGGWKPEMSAWTLRDKNDKEVPHPDAGGHWMDFGNLEWAAHWRNQVMDLVQRYTAYGVVAAELPPGNTFVGDDLAKYKPLKDKVEPDRIEATSAWLHTAREGSRFLLIPSAIGFDALTGHPTLAPPTGSEQPELVGRVWDEFRPMIDGAWAEGWIRPYWLKTSVSEKYWELGLEAADRAAFNDQVFIAGAAYSNTAELEFALASYLLVAKRQGRFVFQPMPTKGTRPDAGYSLAVLRKEYAEKSAYFNVPLGFSYQQRYPVSVSGGQAWKRNYQNGVVYVNPSDTRIMRINLGGTMRRVTGQTIKTVQLPPHTGVILLYPLGQKKS